MIVHGSEAYSAVDHYSEPYMYAANGFATLAFDKRGTGESDGKYLQNFHVLDDVVAAVRWLREQPGIDGNRIHLAGYSQGGWIAPLAALKDGNIRSVLVGYGVMVPVTGEDRWGYFTRSSRRLRRRRRRRGRSHQRGNRRHRSSPESLERARGPARCSQLAALVRERRGDSILGFITGSKMPLWVVRLYLAWRTRAQATRRTSIACTIRCRRCRS